jgi:regulatory protein
MRIEKIEQSKHKQERLLVYLEGGDLLRLTGDTLLRFGLQVGMDLPPEVVVELKEAERQYRVRSRGANIVSSRMVSKKELTDKLERRGATEEEAADTADWLEDLGALNDEAYAAAKFYDSKTRTVRSAVNAYERYLSEYPDGIHAEAAKARLEALKGVEK